MRKTPINQIYRSKRNAIFLEKYWTSQNIYKNIDSKVMTNYGLVKVRLHSKAKDIVVLVSIYFFSHISFHI